MLYDHFFVLFFKDIGGLTNTIKMHVSNKIIWPSGQVIHKIENTENDQKKVLKFNFKLLKRVTATKTLITEDLTFWFLVLIPFACQLCCKIWPHQLWGRLSHSSNQATWKVLTPVSGDLSSNCQVAMFQGSSWLRPQVAFEKKCQKQKYYFTAVTYRNTSIWKSQIQ